MASPARLCGLAAAALACAGLTHAARAQALLITPVSLSLQPGQMTAVIYVTNKGGDAQTVQLRPFAWDQAGGTDNLTPTSLLAASPPMTDIDAGATQLFRIVLRQPAEGVETSYRLLFDELPPPGETGTIRVALRLSVPVFALPHTPGQAALHWSIVLGGGGATLNGENRGTAHIRIVSPVLTQAPGARLGLSAKATYILPGASQSWPIEGGQRLHAGSTVRLTADSDQGPIDASVHPSGP
jgi:fimbrial chaperone protein